MSELFDAAIIGGGPAGLSAAIYLARAGFHVIVLEKEGVGGQVASTYEVANYPGVHPINGYELAQTMQEQAASFGAQFRSFHVGSMTHRQNVWELLSVGAAAERGDANSVSADTEHNAADTVSADTEHNAADTVSAAGYRDSAAGFDETDSTVTRSVESSQTDARSSGSKKAGANSDESSGRIRARGVILCMGAVPRKAGFDGEAEYTGRGVSYCAACDGAFFRGREIFVVGGGTAAVEEGLFLTRFAKKVTLVVRRGRFSCPPSVYRRLAENEKVEVLFHTRITAVSGEDMVTEIRFCSTAENTNVSGTAETGGMDTESRTKPIVPCRGDLSGIPISDASGQKEWALTSEEGFGVFVLAGRQPDTGWLPEAIQRDENGYLITDENLFTGLPCVYAAGDVRSKKLRQIATAVSDGAVAATELEMQLFHKS